MNANAAKPPSSRLLIASAQADKDHAVNGYKDLPDTSEIYQKAGGANGTGSKRDGSNFYVIWRKSRRNPVKPRGGGYLMIAGYSNRPADWFLASHVTDTSSFLVKVPVGDLRFTSMIVAAAGVPSDQETPVWDARSRRLSYRGILVKKLRRDAENQQILLDALQAANWPYWIANPLPPDDDVDVRDRIYNTVKRLNRQHCPLLEFFADGHGTGICWSAFEPTPRMNRPQPATKAPKRSPFSGNCRPRK